MTTPAPGHGARNAEFNVLVVEGRPHRVFVGGDIDLVTAPRLIHSLCDLSGDMTVDCTGITFINTSGFDALYSGYVVATARGNCFGVTGLREFHRRVAEILRMPYVHPR